LEELEALLGTSTTEAQAPAEGEGKKKKKKKDAEAKPVPAEEVKASAETPAVELTAEEKEAAIKEALKKRSTGGQQKANPKATALLAAQIEKAERKQKGKKSGKTEDYDR
jgi:hypothetical protein